MTTYWSRGNGGYRNEDWPLERITNAGEIISIEPYITSRDVKVLYREPYSNGTTTGTRMSVELTRVEPGAQPPLNIRAVTTGRIERTKSATGYQIDINTKRSFSDQRTAPSQSRLRANARMHGGNYTLARSSSLCLGPLRSEDKVCPSRCLLSARCYETVGGM
jgi:hypothetical protein